MIINVLFYVTERMNENNSCNGSKNVLSLADSCRVARQLCSEIAVCLYENNVRSEPYPTRSTKLISAVKNQG